MAAEARPRAAAAAEKYATGQMPGSAARQMAARRCGPILVPSAVSKEAMRRRGVISVFRAPQLS